MPEHSLYYAALGAALYGQQEEGLAGDLRRDGGAGGVHRPGPAQGEARTPASGASSPPREDIEEFRRLYGTKPFTPLAFSPGQVVDAYIGLDGGSTSTKAVLTDGEGNLLAKAYQLCKGNPLQDAKEVLGELRAQVEGQGARLRILGVGTTGYAKDMLKEALGADIAIPETVAHAQSALRYYPDVDVIADVGGQDIKVIIMKRGRGQGLQAEHPVLGRQRLLPAEHDRPLRLSTSASGPSVALSAERAPTFHYGCAVFLEQDISHFQQLGWQPPEIMAGLAADPAQERLAVRRAGDEPGPLRQDLPAAGRHALQPGGGQGPARLHHAPACRTPRSTSTPTPARAAPSALPWRRSA